MTPLRLVRALAEELRSALKGYRLMAAGQENKRVSVYENNLPVADYEVDNYYPFVTVEFLNLEDTAEGSSAAVLMTVGCYCGRRADEMTDLLNISETIREYLLGHRVIGEQFIMELPLYSAVVERRSEEFAFANIFATYKVPQLIGG